MIDVKKVASLARLQITSAEEAKYKTEMAAILVHFEKIAKVDTAGVTPMVSPTESEFFFRDDQAEVTLTTDQALANAPEREGNLFRVPPVV